ncbi:MAG TPA: 4Fe-4S binding protein [Candidatus Rifleibacterium sp.]|jgi:electron transport complex protein RnfB|nr:4Fe-4S binding protein [Candidatus Rifleibacterium sp.]HOI92698.1 4Fe-4S binding protein [Candidatus Rifleibacterium sp.]HPW57393.1 4Fe-4S binding protein [Candidatus Rifleibacterium sp.]
MLTQIISAVLVLGVLGFIFGAILSYASVKFEVKIDPQIEKTLELLPGANCGGCGFPGCAAMAEAIVTKGVPVSTCPVISSLNRIKIEELVGLRKPGEEVKKPVVKAALIKCNGLDTAEYKKFEYMGVPNCQAAVLLQNGPWLCPHRCMGLGSCVAACPFDAIKIGPQHLPIVDEDKCTACGRCVLACPKQIIELVDKEKFVHVKCNSVERGADTRKVCKVGCIGCGLCVKVCAYDAIKVDNNLAHIEYEKCVGCGACVAKCPQKTIIMEDKPQFKGRVALIDQDACIGCTICHKVCKFSAVNGGTPKEKHSIISEKCVGCGLCAEKCPKKCISMVDKA